MEITVKEYLNRGFLLEDIDVSTVRTLLLKRGSVTSIKEGGINATGNCVVVEGLHDGKYHRDVEYNFSVWCTIF